MATNIIDKIRKLRALANSSNANEAAVAAAQADRLIQQHRLEEADIADPASQQSEPEHAEDPLFRWRARTSAWEMRLGAALCRHYDVACYIDHGRRGLRMVGQTGDIRIVREMYAWLHSEIERITKVMSAVLERNEYASFRTGCVVGIVDQLNESKATVRREAASTTAAIVLASRLEESRQAMQRFCPQLRSAGRRFSGPSSYDAFTEGRAEGRRIDLSGSARKLAPGGAS